MNEEKNYNLMKKYKNISLPGVDEETFRETKVYQDSWRVHWRVSAFLFLIRQFFPLIPTIFKECFVQNHFSTWKWSKKIKKFKSWRVKVLRKSFSEKKLERNVKLFYDEQKRKQIKILSMRIEKTSQRTDKA